MSVSKDMKNSIEGASLIRKMFEEGNRRRKIYGDDKVFDFSIGNPVFEPPPKVKESLLKLIQSDEKGTHRYMPNPGFPETRKFIADQILKETNISFDENSIIMTAGAGGAINVIFKTLLDPGDEVIVFTPYFTEYDHYIKNFGGTIIKVSTTDAFRFDFNALESALNPNVKAVLINSPNNPTGVVYSASELDELGQLLTKKSAEFGKTITLISDEPYKKIVFDEPAPSVFLHYPNTIVATSHSKDLALPGERIGYIAISPQHNDAEEVHSGAVIALRILGFVNAPALMQRLIPLVGDQVMDLSIYRKNRDILYDHLTHLGFSCNKPGGAFYLFPKCPIEDDKQFVAAAQEMNLLIVPGSAFGGPGYFRLCFCFETEMVERSLPLFTHLAQQYKMID